MATEQILAPNAATSASFSSDVLAPTTLSLTLFSADARVQVEKQESGGTWRSFRQLSPSEPIWNLVANGTWRVRRTAGGCGVDRS
jgi:hypothetical protein